MSEPHNIPYDRLYSVFFRGARYEDSVMIRVEASNLTEAAKRAEDTEQGRDGNLTMHHVVKGYGSPHDF